MAPTYWIKLYHEILEDPKMMRMDEATFSRCIKIFLLAGKMNSEGYLPSIEDIAWHLRLPEPEIETTLYELEKVKIVIQDGDRWLVRKFMDRNKAMNPAEKMRLYRQEKKVHEYHEDMLPENYQPVTKSNIESESESESEAEEKQRRVDDPGDIRLFSPAPAAPSLSIEGVICKASGMVALPPKEYGRIEQVRSFIEKYGEDKTVSVMSDEFRKWTTTKRKDGNGTYRATNLGWVDWAQETLLKNANAPPQEAEIEITPEQQAAHDAHVAKIRAGWESQRNTP